MSTITLKIQTEDVATLREVFSLALVQSEATLDDAIFNTIDGAGEANLSDVYETHNAVCRLMARIDAMLPDSTGFFD